MAGQPTFSVSSIAGDYANPGAAPVRGGSGRGSHTSFLVWVVLLGVVLPMVILGGLKMGGFSFVFRGRG